MSQAPHTISEDPAQREVESDSEVIACLLCQRWNFPWSTDELAREIGKPLDVEDSIVRLVRAGLLHHNDRYVWPTRAAQHAAMLDIGVA